MAVECEEGMSSLLREDGILKYRGVAIIAVFKEFKNDKDNLYCLEKDIEMLRNGFSALHYGVVVWDDKMDKKTFFRRIKYVSSHSVLNDSETFAMVIITHGLKDGKLLAFDETFSRNKVCKQFFAKKCKGLENKTKLFIFQACRGDPLVKGVQASGNIRHANLWNEKVQENVEKDFIVLTTTFEGNFAFSSAEKDTPSIFASALHFIMTEEASKPEEERKNILKILTALKGIIASVLYEYEGNIMLQQPASLMTIRKPYYFKDKEEIPHETLKDLSKESL